MTRPAFLIVDRSANPFGNDHLQGLIERVFPFQGLVSEASMLNCVRVDGESLTIYIDGSQHGSSGGEKNSRRQSSLH